MVKIAKAQTHRAAQCSIFAANRPDMSSGLGGESTDLRRDMKTIKIKDIIYRLWSEGNPII
jgi:glutamine amidotransferase PdxT